MNELHKKLLHMKNLVGGLDQLNQKENYIKSQMKPLLSNDVYVAKKVTKKYFVIISAIAAVLLLLTASTFISDIQRAYKNDVVDDEFQWVLNHPGEEYPGYEKDSSIVASTFASDFGPTIFIIVVIAGGYIAVIRFVNSFKKKEVNENNIKISEQNYDNKSKNMKLLNEVSNIERERAVLYAEVIRNLQEWFPKDYCFMSAIDYFINIVENHLADTIQKAVELYLAEMRNNILNKKLDLIGDRIQVTINNQQIIISKQDEMIRQQIIGNYINLANLANNIEMRSDMKRAANAAESAASSAASAASSAASAASK